MSEVTLDAPPRAEVPDRQPVPRSKTPHKIRRALGFARPHRRAVLVIAVLTLLVAGVNAVEPLVLKYVFDGLAGGDGARTLVVGVGILLAVSVLRELVVAWSNWRTWNTRLRLQFALLEATIGRLHRMPLALQRSEGVGAILTRLDRSLQGFIGAVTELLFNVFPAVLYLVISVGIMVQLDWRLALLVLAFTPLPALIAALAAPEQTTRQRILMDRWARIYSRFNEVLSGLPTVRSFSMEQAEKARFLRDVRAANAHDFIMRLPDGYDTPVGERGSRLSVGERQRLSIARALIKDARIIVLDEATASLDAESEALVQDALDTLMHGRTTFVIAHRLATVVNADQILVLQQGRVTERGRHGELLRAGGYYASLVARQTRGLIQNDGAPMP